MTIGGGNKSFFFNYKYIGKFESIKFESSHTDNYVPVADEKPVIKK